MRKVVYQFEEIARAAGFLPAGDGKFNLPATQDVACRLARVVTEIVGDWHPDDDRLSVTLTGAGPVWAYLAIAHALHGRCAQMTYSAPNATIEIWSHGV